MRLLGQTKTLHIFRDIITPGHPLCLVPSVVIVIRQLTPLSVSASHLLSNLHWPPVRKRIDFKIATPTYKVLSTQQPAYLHNLLSYHQPSRVLRSSSQLLEVPRTKTEFGRRAFSSASPQIWNDIPLPIRYSPSLDSFKRHLKTFLFTCP